MQSQNQLKDSFNTPGTSTALSPPVYLLRGLYGKHLRKSRELIYG